MDHVKWSIIHVFYSLFGKSDDSAILNKNKQNIHLLKEDQLMQQEQIGEQYELFNLTKVETANNRKLLKKLDREI